MYLAGDDGLVWNNEEFTDDQPQRNSMEGLAAFELNLFNIKDFSFSQSIYHVLNQVFFFYIKTN